ncbi:MAG TPA: DnaJ family domain-containing protein [Burkholderiales bacterium]|nr:DnaJ family domain-containing protein [Burkholderiales bacterium]
MLIFDLLAEKKIRAAAERGELDDLPGAGRPLELDDDTLVPEDLRMASRILRNAGFDRAPVTQRMRLLEKARIEARYFGKVVRKLSRSGP